MTAKTRLPAIIAIAVLLAVKLAVELNAPRKDDVAWLLHVAEDWIGGHALYSHLIEFNPPPIIWLSAVPVMIGQAIGVPALLVMPVFCAALMLASAWWSAALLVRRGIFAEGAAVCAVILAVLLFIPAGEFAQREQFITAAMLPYLALRVRPRPGSTPIPVHEAVLAGALVAFGCAMKPWYAVAILLVEATMVARGARWQMPAILGALVTGVAILAISLLAHPDYLAKAVPMAMSLYQDADDLAAVLPRGTLLLLGALAAALAMWWWRGEGFEDGDAMLILLLFAIGGLAAYFLQYKGWFYHRLPATAATFGALLIWFALRPPGSALWRTRLLLIPAVLASLALVEQAGNRFAPRVAIAARLDVPIEKRMIEILREEQAQSYMAFSRTLSLGFPVAPMTPAVWASRFASMWAVLGELDAEQSGQAGATPSTVARSLVVRDFLATCPDIVIMDRTGEVDYPAVLGAVDPAFTRAWSGYVAFRQEGSFTIYRRTPAAGPCEGPA